MVQYDFLLSVFRKDHLKSSNPYLDQFITHWWSPGNGCGKGNAVGLTIVQRGTK